MSVSKVVYGDTTLIDISNDTVTADKLLSGYTSHGADGEQITGELVIPTYPNFNEEEF